MIIETPLQTTTAETDNAEYDDAIDAWIATLPTAPTPSYPAHPVTILLPNT